MNKVNIKYLLITVLAVLASWFLHELAHWGMGKSLGYDMFMSLNKCFPMEGSFKNQRDYNLISAAGPVFTLLQAVVVFLVMKFNHRKLLYSFLFTAFYMRLLAASISIINPNDEAKISKWLGIGTFTLPIIMTAVLFFLLFYISNQYGFNKKFNAVNLGLIVLISSVIILSDQFFNIRIL